MLGLIYILTAYYNGYVLHKVFLGKSYGSIIAISSFVLGSLFSVTFVFLLTIIVGNLASAVSAYFILFSVLFILTAKRLVFVIRKFRVRRAHILMLALLFIFFVVFQRSFSYDPIHHNFLIETHLYVDMGAHIPMIRYFSIGKNIVPDVPFYAGMGLVYHFMFDFYTAILELLGLRIDYAINIISALSFLFLINMIYKVSTYLFKDKFIGYIAPALFIFTSDLSFIQLFAKYGVSLSGLVAIYHNNTYIQGNILGLTIPQDFFYMNVYLNQRQMIFALLLLLFILYIVFQTTKWEIKKLLLIALLIGFSPFWNFSIIISIYLLLFTAFIFFKKLRKIIFYITLLSLVLVLPQALFIKAHSFSHIIFRPGFIISSNLTPLNFVLFWVWNLGVCLPLVAIALFYSNYFQRKIFLIFSSLFLAANLFQFSPEMLDNHKFFNIWGIVVSIFSAYAIVGLLQKGTPVRFLSFLLLLLATLSGITNILIIKNDIYAKIPDYVQSDLMVWVNKNIKPGSILFTNGDIYDPASISGEKTFLGGIITYILMEEDQTLELRFVMRFFWGM